MIVSFPDVWLRNFFVADVGGRGIPADRCLCLCAGQCLVDGSVH